MDEVREGVERLADDLVRMAERFRLDQAGFEALAGAFRMATENAIRAARVRFMKLQEGGDE